MKEILITAGLLLAVTSTIFSQSKTRDTLPSDLYYAQESFSADMLLYLSDENKVIIESDKVGRYTMYLLNEKNIVTDRVKTRGSFMCIPLNSKAFATCHLGGGELYVVNNGELKLKKQTDKASYAAFLDTISSSSKAFCRDIPVKLLKETDFYIVDLTTSERIKTFFSAKDYKLQYDYSKREYAIPNVANITALTENNIRQFLGGYNAFYHLSQKDLSVTLFCLPKVKGGWGYVHDRLMNRDFFIKRSENAYDMYMLNTSKNELQFINTLTDFPYQIYGNRYFYRSKMKISNTSSQKKNKKSKVVYSWHVRDLFTHDKGKPAIPVEINCNLEGIASPQEKSEKD